jgi:hypothetical protein
MTGYASFADLVNITLIVTKMRILPQNEVPWKGLIIAVQIPFTNLGFIPYLLVNRGTSVHILKPSLTLKSPGGIMFGFCVKL